MWTILRFFHLFGLPLVTRAFLTTSLSHHSPPTSTTLLYHHQAKKLWGQGDEEAFDVEAVRQRLESILTTSGGSHHPSSTRTHAYHAHPSAAISPPLDVVLPTPPPPTALDRVRRFREQELLEKLKEGDEALTDLWDFWFQERGTHAAACLVQAEELTGQGPSYWPQAEIILAALIEEYGVYWAEPVNRLATLYFIQGRFEDSETLCQIVLAVKPWHFGALSGIVMVYESLRESQKARQWAARRLPTFAPKGNNRRRQEWVKNALKDSQAAIEDAERRLQEWMGPKDDYTSLTNAWQ